MKRKHKIGIKVFIVILVLLIILGANLFFHNNPKICFASKCFNLEIANTVELRTKGLMDRTIMPVDNGMIFVFEINDIHSFRMKNTLIPLDMIRLNQDLQVVDIANAVPCNQDICQTYVPDGPSKYVLEINGGESAKIGLKIGDQMKKKGKR